MVKQNIAVKLLEAEYYTLQEASNYINAKYKIDVVNPKLLLKKILEFRLNAFVIGIGFNLEYPLFSHDFDSIKTNKLALHDYREITKRINELLNHECKNKGVLLQLNPSAIKKIVNFNQALISENNQECFYDVRSFNDLSINFLEYSLSIMKNNFDFKNLNLDLIYVPLPIVPHLVFLNENNLQALLKEIPFDSIKYHAYETDDDYDYFGLEFVITTNDIIVLHSDILILETNLLKPSKNNTLEINQKNKNNDDVTNNECIIEPKPLAPKTANNASKIILAMAELLKLDLSQPYSQDCNGKIAEVLNKLNSPLGNDTIAFWLKKAYDIGK